MFTQESLTLKVSTMTTKVNNLPSNNVAVMIGILRVAEINELPDGKWMINVLWEHAFPFGSCVVTTREEGIKEVMSRIQE